MIQWIEIQNNSISDIQVKSTFHEGYSSNACSWNQSFESTVPHSESEIEFMQLGCRDNWSVNLGIVVQWIDSEKSETLIVSGENPMCDTDEIIKSSEGVVRVSCESETCSIECVASAADYDPNLFK